LHKIFENVELFGGVGDLLMEYGKYLCF